MVCVRFIDAGGTVREIEASEGMSLMENAVAQGIEAIEAVCGGNCYCGTCRVHLTPEWFERLGAPGDYEGPVIEASGDEHPRVRLSCQIQVSEALEGLVVETPASQS